MAFQVLIQEVRSAHVIRTPQRRQPSHIDYVFFFSFIFSSKPPVFKTLPSALPWRTRWECLRLAIFRHWGCATNKYTQKLTRTSPIHPIPSKSPPKQRPQNPLNKPLAVPRSIVFDVITRSGWISLARKIWGSIKTNNYRFLPPCLRSISSSSSSPTMKQNRSSQPASRKTKWPPFCCVWVYRLSSTLTKNYPDWLVT